MRKLLFFIAFFVTAIPFLSGCSDNKKNELDPNKIYFFYQSTCPHCHHALEYINRVAPNVEMEMVSIDGEGRSLFIKCVEKFNLPQNSIGTPLICMGDNYLMGWSDSYEEKFDEYVEPYRLK